MPVVLEIPLATRITVSDNTLPWRIIPAVMSGLDFTLYGNLVWLPKEVPLWTTF